MLTIAAEYNLNIDHFDAVTTFLQGDFSKEIYMLQPGGFQEPHKVCKIQKSLYGHKPASKIWNLRLDKCLKQYDLTELTRHNILIVAVYVDDMVIFSNDISRILVRSDLC